MTPVSHQNVIRSTNTLHFNPDTFTLVVGIPKPEDNGDMIRSNERDGRQERLTH